MNYLAALSSTALLAVVLVGCTDAEAPPEEPSASPPPASTSSAEPEPEPEYLPAGDLPEALSLKEVGGRTITAKPFADFAVGAGSGVWVSGVGPGIVRYDGASSEVTARTRIRGDVVQALEATRAEVLVPSLNPSALFRLDPTTGAVLARVELPASPLVESVVGAAGTTAYVLVEPSAPRIVAIEDDEVVEEIEVPEGAVAVRAGFGSLWVPTSRSTLERYSLEDSEWTTIGTGPNPRFFDLGFGAAWVMNQGDGSVTRVDATSGEAEHIPVTGVRIGGGDLTVGAGGVWLRTDASVLRIDPGTRRVTHLIDLPPGSGSVAAVPGSLWITNHDHLAVHRVPLPLP
ncbi:hypothetical protein SAMN05192575_101713 [Nocardioides alpinus]|uniref:40-residue YVTN family beta-propeller repeat-containing protein n=1 Tax=Nocardioides alpinus TaxID=748909 RepID=A0A1I0W684_9ACTN|nr:hypothetical protein [Nocardioides alpinus]PKH37694.1 hypothetical protein CXG46_19940 [Nocardioides alpinus]SFA83790.1 hypothetical protein SAMN05192575_101713 [Nocardioides alpinus]